ncbi:hypothetical protein ABES02_25185 [Neobacillus pocheonensis]|uniref:hypothetical protein n=1 Tax=Neobacillus pocheonensis TaxID=363869 RepID=UPI003D2B2C8A
MDQGNYELIMRNYIEEALQVKESYDTAKKGVVEEYEVRKRVLEDVKFRFQKTEEAFNRGNATQDAYNQVKNDHKRAEETLNELEQKLDELNRYMVQRIEAVLANLNDLNEQFVEDIALEKKKLTYHLKKAKYDYLKETINVNNDYKKQIKHAEKDYKKQMKLVENEYKKQMKLVENEYKKQLNQAENDFKNQQIYVKKDFDKTSKQIRSASKNLQKEESFLKRISNYLGLDSIIELIEDFQVASSEGNDIPGVTSTKEDFQVTSTEVNDDLIVTVTKEELHDALYSGRIPAELEKEVSEAISEGLI